MADNDREDLASAFRTELFNGTIYVLTPHGKVLSLPVGATPIDFAYALHSSVATAAAAPKWKARSCRFPPRSKRPTGGNHQPPKKARPR